MKKYDKIFTDNPFIDELLYFTKTIAGNVVIKDSDEADLNETLDSLEYSDLYIACREGRARFDDFNYSYEFLIKYGVLPAAIVEQCAKDNTRIPDKYRETLLQYMVQEYIQDYVELNNYYRTLAGLPDKEDEEDEYVYVNKDYLIDIPTLSNANLPVHEMSNEDLTILYSHGIIDDLINDYPDKKYLKFMGDNKIDIYKARKALNFQILYIPTVSNNELMDRWNTKYEQNRMYTLKTYYSEAYKLYSDYYNNFIMVFILLQTMIDIISEVQEFIARKDIFDDRSIRYLFESYGIPYYPEIPRVYQIAMVKNINTLLKWKASTKNMIDICSLFGFDEVEIFRYYLLRDRRLVPDYDNDKTNDEYQFNYKTIIDENGEEKIVPDNDKNYELKFIKTPIDEKADDYLKDKTAYEDYDIITEQDEFWDGQSDHEDIKSAILDQEFSWVRTKYISIDTLYDLSEMCFDLPYFLNIFVDDWLKEDYLYVKIPTIKNNHSFRVNDLFVYLMSITHIYHGFEDNIMQEPSKILSILGFNFHVDVHELAFDIWENTRMDINEMGADYFYIPEKQITNFDYLLKLFTKNKEIWNTVREGMFHADNKRVYNAYKKVYDSYYISDYTTTFFKLQDGTIAKTYTDFLKERDHVLYQSILDLKSYTDQASVQKAISDIIIEIVYVLNEYLDSDEFKYVFSKFPAVSGDYIRSYMLKVVNFFKSYKVHLLDISTVYKAFDKRENSIKIYDDWITNVSKEPEDYSQIIEEITSDINLTKSDKVKILEKMYFDIECWEFKNFDDYIIIKEKIQSIVSKLILSEYINIIDYYDDHPFAGIEYTYDKTDRSDLIESVDSEIDINLKEKYKIFDKLKIYYED